MYPILIHWNNIIIPSWHVFYVTAFIASWYLTQYLAPKKPNLTEHLTKLFIIIYISGYFGSRLFNILVFNEYSDNYSKIPLLLFQLGGMTFYGGFILSILASTIYLYRKEINPMLFADIILPASMIGLAIGRFGCFLNGDDYGKPAGDFWAGVIFPNLNDSIHRHPTQLYEMILCLLLFFSSRLCKDKVGSKSAYIILGYALGRFLLEFLRGDYRGNLGISWLSTSQTISLTICTLTLVYFSWKKLLQLQK